MSFLSDEQLAAILELTVGKIDEKELLRRFPIPPDRRAATVLDILGAALESKSSSDVDGGMLLGFWAGFSGEHASVLTRLLDESWHRRHEDIVSVLGKLRYAGAVDAIYRAALTKHAYLAWDDACALGVKCVWSLVKIATPEAIASLKKLARCDNRIVRRNARQRLHQRARDSTA